MPRKREPLPLKLIYQIRDNWDKLAPEDQLNAARILEAYARDEKGWPIVYVNSDTKNLYQPHNEREAGFVEEDGPRYGLLRGGEGSGKTTAGVIKTLGRVRRKMSGIMVSPNLPHMKRSLWPEFRRWCPWGRVVKSHQRFGKLDWEPHEPFNIVFKNDAVLHVAGIEKPGSLEGPNINFAHFDEARHHPDGKALKVLDGRIRIPGPDGEMPQMWFTTTPAMNWLYEYFGPLQCKCPEHGDVMVEIGAEIKCPECSRTDVLVTDLYPEFKADARDVTLFTRDNEPNLFDGFSQKRAQTLTEIEARVLLEAAWEDISEGQPFLPDMVWWDTNREDLPPLKSTEQVVLALDAATGRMATASDCFAIVGVTRHPTRRRSSTDIAARYVRIWQGKAGEKIDFRGTDVEPGPERELLRLCGYELNDDGSLTYNRDLGINVACVVYDPTELHDMATRLSKEGVACFREFPQGVKRNEADKQLLDLIQQRRCAHDGNPVLRTHIKNADRKMGGVDNRLRIVKRVESQKIDAAVALSMAAWQCLYWNL